MQATGYAGGHDFTFTPAIYLSEKSYIAPFWCYTRSHGKEAEELEFMNFTKLLDRLDMHQVGIDINIDEEKYLFWFSGAYQFGDARVTDSDNVTGLELADIFPAGAAGQKVEFDGLTLSLGGSVKPMPVFDMHGEFIYATGEKTSPDDIAGLKDKKLSRYVVFSSASHPWAEIMGLGMFGNQYSIGSPGDEITNLVAYNLGVTVKPLEKLSVTLDYWHAELEEEDGFGNTELGTELDLKIACEIIKELKLDIVGAYLWAGDATSINGESTEDPYELGVQLTYKF